MIPHRNKKRAYYCKSAHPTTIPFDPEPLNQQTHLHPSIPHLSSQHNSETKTNISSTSAGIHKTTYLQPKQDSQKYWKGNFPEYQSPASLQGIHLPKNSQKSSSRVRQISSAAPLATISKAQHHPLATTGLNTLPPCGSSLNAPKSAKVDGKSPFISNESKCQQNQSTYPKSLKSHGSVSPPGESSRVVVNPSLTSGPIDSLAFKNRSSPLKTTLCLNPPPEGSSGAAGGVVLGMATGTKSRGGALTCSKAPNARERVQVCRTHEEKELNPNSISLNKRGLRLFPEIGGGEGITVKFLSLQHNFITRLENLPMLTQLVVLDLYDNRVDRIMGLQGLPSLRVLLLGKNRIRRLEGLEGLKRLEVLDLHGNLLRYVKNLSSLSSLRVLNLAGNMLRNVRDVGPYALTSLTELNLKRNRIKTLEGLHKVPHLKKLLVANNDLQSFAGFTPLRKLSFLQELVVDPNPLMSIPEYKNQLLTLIPTLHTLDRNPVTDAMKQEARQWYKQKLDEETRAQEQARLNNEASLAIGPVGSREQVIYQARRRWESLKSFVKSTAPTNDVPVLLPANPALLKAVVAFGGTKGLQKEPPPTTDLYPPATLDLEPFPYGNDNMDMVESLLGDSKRDDGIEMGISMAKTISGCSDVESSNHISPIALIEKSKVVMESIAKLTVGTKLSESDVICVHQECNETQNDRKTDANLSDFSCLTSEQAVTGTETKPKEKSTRLAVVRPLVRGESGLGDLAYVPPELEDYDNLNAPGSYTECKLEPNQIVDSIKSLTSHIPDKNENEFEQSTQFDVDFDKSEKNENGKDSENISKDNSVQIDDKVDLKLDSKVTADINVETQMAKNDQLDQSNINQLNQLMPMSVKPEYLYEEKLSSNTNEPDKISMVDCSPTLDLGQIANGNVKDPEEYDATMGSFNNAIEDAIIGKTESQPLQINVVEEKSSANEKSAPQKFKMLRHLRSVSLDSSTCRNPGPNADLYAEPTDEDDEEEDSDQDYNFDITTSRNRLMHGLPYRKQSFVRTRPRAKTGVVNSGANQLAAAKRVQSGVNRRGSINESTSSTGSGPKQQNSGRLLRRCDSATNSLADSTRNGTSVGTGNDGQSVAAMPLLRKQGADFLMEVDGKLLNIFGQGALKYALTAFPPAVNNQICIVKFHYISYHAIVPFFGRFRQTYSSIEHIHFRANNLYMLSQLDALSDLQGLTSLFIAKEGNPLVEHEAWIHYASYRLSHWGLQNINGKEVCSEYRNGGIPTTQTKDFDSLGFLALSCLPLSALTPLAKRLHMLHCFCCCSPSTSSDESCRLPKRTFFKENVPSEHNSARNYCTSWDDDPVLLDVIGKEALVYVPAPTCDKQEECPNDGGYSACGRENHVATCSTDGGSNHTNLTCTNGLAQQKQRTETLGQVVSSGVKILKKVDELQKIWPTKLTEVIQQILLDYRFMDSYMKRETKNVMDNGHNVNYTHKKYNS